MASNFSDLIDLADIGRKVAGLSPNQPRGQGRGLQLDENLKLAVLPQVAGGISVSDTGVGITVETDKGITVGPNGLAIKPGNGLYLGAAGVGVTAAADMGLAVDARGWP
ncbi:hypothetical protein [Pseudomonas chlororaphis]|uniref:hypothetical protein n=1 Tax=Pseudomonas chlororaphis TaxID=587753 RepID=UPI0012DA4F9C|nr:hypothetical protein [Pseudomonas chlororaphis]